MSACKPIPADAATTLPTLIQKAACERYGVSKYVIKRWCRELGVETAEPDRSALARGSRNVELVLPPDSGEMITCNVCGQHLSVLEFPHALLRATGQIRRMGKRCRTCNNERKRARAGARHGGPTAQVHADPWARELYLQALRAFDLARSEITEDDYA